MLTFLPLEEIDAMESWEGAQLNQAKEILAFELTKLVHGEEEATQSKRSIPRTFRRRRRFRTYANCRVDPLLTLQTAIWISLLSSRKSRARSIPFRRKTCRRTGRCLRCRRESNRYPGPLTDADSFGADGLVVKRGKKKFVKVIVK